MYVVLCIPASVSLFRAFLGRVLRSHYVRVVYSCMVIGLLLCVPYCYHCESTSRRRMLLISRFIYLVVYLLGL